jgi:UDP-3-O-[3-hydroxymyristoyl] N-acetylglucosamine deacetylase
MDLTYQRTLKKVATCTGIGLHSGQPVTLRVLPAPAEHGIVFRRQDDGGRLVRARAENVQQTRFATTLSENGTSVATTEHVLSALNALGIDNALLELDGAEVPILDGSAAPFLLMLHEAGVQELAAPRRLLVIEEPVSVAENGAVIRVEPASGFEVVYAIDFAHPVIAAQRFESGLDLRTYIEEIAPARTFCFLKDVEGMRRIGLALGGSLDNAVVVGDHGVLNEALRYPDEFVRHKVLDLIGDLSLLGLGLVGRVVAERAGHRLHTRLVREILSRPGSWSLRQAGERALPVFPSALSLAPQPLAAAF